MLKENEGILSIFQGKIIAGFKLFSDLISMLNFGANNLQD